MDEVEFRNLVGRVGRIKYNLYGNVFLVRMEDNLKTEKYISLLQNDVPTQEVSINIIDNKCQTRIYNNIIKYAKENEY